MNEIGGHSRAAHTPAIRAKLTVSQSGGAHEQEADRVANGVMRMRPE